jgi:hypothetical protein
LNDATINQIIEVSNRAKQENQKSKKFDFNENKKLNKKKDQEEVKA